jgi:negative regulator of replication initiation
MNDSECLGTNTVSTKVDDEMLQFVQEQADYRGVPKAEFLRRLLEVHRASEGGKLTCSNCSEELKLPA